MPPEFRRAPAQVVMPLYEIVEFNCHGISLQSTVYGLRSSVFGKADLQVRLRPIVTSATTTNTIET
jgi:hypothetical protein